MKVFINGVLYDSEKTPIAWVFDDTEELKDHVENLQAMTLTNKEGTPRIYSMANDEVPEEEHLDFVNQAIVAWESSK